MAVYSESDWRGSSGSLVVVVTVVVTFSTMTSLLKGHFTGPDSYFLV